MIHHVRLDTTRIEDHPTLALSFSLSVHRRWSFERWDESRDRTPKTRAPTKIQRCDSLVAHAKQITTTWVVDDATVIWGVSGGQLSRDRWTGLERQMSRPPGKSRAHTRRIYQTSHWSHPDNARHLAANGGIKCMGITRSERQHAGANHKTIKLR